MLALVVTVGIDQDVSDTFSRLLSTYDIDSKYFSDSGAYLDSRIFDQDHAAIIGVDPSDYSPSDVIYAASTKSSALGVFGLARADSHPNHVIDALRAGAMDVLAPPYSIKPILRCLAQRSNHLECSSNLLPSYMPELRDLSDREREVLDQLIQGQTNKSIAKNLSISVRTVETHRAKIYQKLGVNSQVELFDKLR